MDLDNKRLAPYFAPAYYLAMAGKSFRHRVVEAMKAQGLSKAELSRRSGVPYHTLDKFAKGTSSTTSAENAVALANALGIYVDGDAEYEELRRLYFELSPERREFVLASIRGLLGTTDHEDQQ